MPCIQTKVNVPLSAEQKEVLKTELGKAISLIPGKSENWLMLTFEDNCSIFFRETEKFLPLLWKLKSTAKQTAMSIKK